MKLPIKRSPKPVSIITRSKKLRKFETNLINASGGCPVYAPKARENNLDKIFKNFTKPDKNLYIHDQHDVVIIINSVYINFRKRCKNA